MIQGDLGLEVDVGELPPWIFEGPSPSADHAAWLEWEHAASEKDRCFPVEYLIGGVRLRKIEGDVWLWGAVWRGPTGGGGFDPFRKWGPNRAAMTRDAAITAARLYIAQRLEACRS